MINVLDDVKTLYKSDSIPKNYFIVFRDKVGGEDNGQYVMLTNENISSESLQIVESICSSGDFKVGLCESASAKTKVVLTDNVKGNEIFIFQVLQGFEPEIEIDDTKGIQLTDPALTELSSTFTSANIISGLDSNNFSKDSNYLVFAKLKYIGKPIYLYVETTGGNSRMVYYLKPNLFNFSNINDWVQGTEYKEGAIVLHNGYVWQSLTYNNVQEPSDNINSWKNITHYIQIVIPLIGNEFYEYKMAIYANDEEEYGVLEGDATIYEIAKPIMPLGLFTIRSCKRSNDNLMRDLECYDRMQDVGLDVDVYLTGSTSIRLGQVLDQAASDTQIVIGSNLSKDPVNPILVSEEIVPFDNFPSNVIYEADKTETQAVRGTYSESVSTYCTLDHTRTEQTFKDGAISPNTNGAYTQTQMQIIDGSLDETATSTNKEYSTTLWGTFKGTVIEADDANYDASSPNYRSKGKRRKTTTTKDTRVVEITYKVRWNVYFSYEVYVIIDGEQYWSHTEYIYSDSEGYAPEGFDSEQAAINYANSFPEAEVFDTYTTEFWDEDHPVETKSFNPIPATILVSNRTYTYSGSYTQTRSDSYPEDPEAGSKWRITYTRTYTYNRDTDYGYLYTAGISGWSMDTAYHNTEYYTGIGDKSGWTDTTGNPIKANSYLDRKKTLYWKYTWDNLDTKGTGDSNWTWYDTQAYQSSTAGSGAKYPLTSTRPAGANYYTKAGTIYSSASVYKIMSRRYTRTHKFNYTFTPPSGNGWTVYYTSDSKYDSQHNYIADSSSGNRQYNGVTFDAKNTFTNQKKVGIYSNVTVYYSLRRDYRRNVAYGYVFVPPSGSGWSHPDPDYNKNDDIIKYRAGSVQDNITQINTVYNTEWRNYTRTVIYKWTEDAVLKKNKYAIPYDIYNNELAYTVYFTYPTDSKAYIEENGVKELAQQQIVNYTSDDGLYTSTGTFPVDNQQDVRDAILDNSSKRSEVEIGTYDDGGVTRSSGVFYIYWVTALSYVCMVQYGDDTPVQDYVLSGIIYAANPFTGCVSHSQAEKFNDMPVLWGKETIHGTRRSIIAGFLELHGMFINFDRWGVSTIRNVKASTLYPAEDLYPHDSTIPGNEAYGDIYPSIGSTEVTTVSICKSIYIDDDLNKDFGGVLISKSSIAPEEAGIFPFYYNRLSKRYGTVPLDMPEIGYWEGNTYYHVENNFFIDNFIFGQNQTEIINNLKAICQQILSIIGNLQYFNLTAELRALPYMEVGDSINIMTPNNGYETAILRRVMKGNLAQMDSIETDFYD